MKGFAELDAVIAVARRGSFRAAAVDLDMSTTALSHAVARLEKRLGVRLFNRTTRSVALTEAGRDFVERARPALDDLRAAMDAARSQGSSPSGVLRINGAPGAALDAKSSWLPKVSPGPNSRTTCCDEPSLAVCVARKRPASIM